MQPHQRRALTLRDSFTPYDALYVALAESLHVPLLTDHSTDAEAAGYAAVIETWP